MRFLKINVLFIMILLVSGCCLFDLLGGGGGHTIRRYSYVENLTEIDCDVKCYIYEESRPTIITPELSDTDFFIVVHVPAGEKVIVTRQELVYEEGGQTYLHSAFNKMELYVDYELYPDDIVKIYNTSVDSSEWLLGERDYDYIIQIKGNIFVR